MLRISRLTDYAIVLMAYMGRNSEVTHKASDLTKATAIAGPTVSKLLKKLTKSNFLISSRGVNGGYKLLRDIHTISLAEIIAAIEGPLGLTACSLQETLCSISQQCHLKAPWIKISKAIIGALENYKLHDLINVKAHHQENSAPPKHYLSHIGANSEPVS